MLRISAVFAVLSLAVCASNATQSIDATTKKVLDLLESKLTADEFVQQMTQLAENCAVDLRSLHMFFSIREAALNEPCSLENVEAFEEARSSLTSGPGCDLQQAVESLFARRPYALYCVSEFDKLASIAYSLNYSAESLFGIIYGLTMSNAGLVSGVERTIANERIKLTAQNFMTRLAKSIPRPARESMIFDELQASLHPNSRKANAPENLIDSFRHSMFCSQIEESQAIQSMLQIMQRLLAKTSNLRTQELINALSLQIDSLEPNTVKILSLAIFCMQVEQ